MRHQKRGRKIGRYKSHREALLKNLSLQVFKYGKIKTTEAKAKEVRSLVEKIIGLAKRKDLVSKRRIASLIPEREVAQKIFEEIAPRFEQRKSGYVRVLKVGRRAGDAAPMVLIELL